jgi:NAD(P)-dependent dehydrogenase (short-subunit alcohol dehydrogenase family)
MNDTQISLRGHTALITGAGRGMGRAIAIRLAEAGCDVALAARDAEQLDTTAVSCRALGVRALTLPVDLAMHASAGHTVTETTQTLGGLNIVVHAAGTHQFASSADADLTVWDRILAVNLHSAMHITRHALPHVIAGRSRSQRGALVYISSLGGKFSAPTNAGYAASKFALTGFAGSVFEDVRDHGIKVCTLYPGWTNTGMLADWLDPALAIQPEHIAALTHMIVTFPDAACPTEIVIHPQSSKAASLFG